MREYRATVTIHREADTVHTKIELSYYKQIEIDMLIALEFLKIVLDSAEKEWGSRKTVKKSIKGMLEDFINADAERRKVLLRVFVACNDILGEEEQE
jgi:hypothetical protein|nr:MAG TPA: hypothetical protein [Caudoviricetes sp.]